VNIFVGSRACVGDSGGGFAIKRNKTWFLRGVVSYGAGNDVAGEFERQTVCDKDIPSFYVDLAAYMDWIVQAVAKYS